jgi:hypothetical protein
MPKAMLWSSNIEFDGADSLLDTFLSFSVFADGVG